MARVEARHFWFRAKRALAARFLGEAMRGRGPARALGHRRRYRRGELESRAREEGFAVERSTGWGLPLVPVVAILRRLRPRGGRSDVREVPAPVNAAFAFLLGVERALLRWFPSPA